MHLRKKCLPVNQGHFMNETVVIPLVELLQDPNISVQVAALNTIGNVVVDLTTRRSAFIGCDGMRHFIQLAKSMDSTVRLNALWALRNLMFLADKTCKEVIVLDITASLLASLVCDPVPVVQVQALGLVRNLVDGCLNAVEFMFAEDAIGRQLNNASKAEIGI